MLRLGSIPRTLLALLGATLLLAGCVGAVDFGAVLGALLMLGAAARLHAQPPRQVDLQSLDPSVWQELALKAPCTPQTYQACVDGEVVTQTACCPAGVVCNYGQIGVKTCPDGSCVTRFEECPDSSYCVPQTYQSCDEGQVVTHHACCPVGVACNFGQIGVKMCPDGSCVTRFQDCPKQTCIPQTYQICEDGAVVTKSACCPVGVACNYGQIGIKLCADGFCVAGNESCPDDASGDECQPQSYAACEAGVVVTKQACCPPGVVCNFGQSGMSLCRDGSCVSGRARCLDLKLQSIAR